MRIASCANGSHANHEACVAWLEGETRDLTCNVNPNLTQRATRTRTHRFTPGYTHITDAALLHRGRSPAPRTRYDTAQFLLPSGRRRWLSVFGCLSFPTRSCHRDPKFGERVVGADHAGHVLAGLCALAQVRTSISRAQCECRDAKT